MFINFVVIFMIFAIMNTISSVGLPGRIQRETTSFKVLLKIDPTVTDNKDRFERPEEITDVCQGLGWWMEGDPIHTCEYIPGSPFFVYHDLSFSPFTRRYRPMYTNRLSSLSSSVCSSLLLSPLPALAGQTPSSSLTGIQCPPGTP